EDGAEGLPLAVGAGEIAKRAQECADAWDASRKSFEDDEARQPWKRTELAKQRNELQKRCLSLIWALKDLPREREVLRAIDQVRGQGPGAADQSTESSQPVRHLTLLQSVARAGFEEPVRMLCEIGAAANAKDPNGMTALHHAARCNNVSVTKALLARGHAHVNARDSRGRTPLHLAASRGHRKVALLLVRFGASAVAEDDEGNAPNTSEGRAVWDRAGREPTRLDLGEWSRTFVEKRRAWSSKVSPWPVVRTLGAALPHHVRAPELKLTTVGFCPVDEDTGEIIQLKRGIRQRKGRPAPSSPKNFPNWYAPRG
ncbi:unnamed protein product, partial [Prorocentrum cordatum]